MSQTTQPPGASAPLQPTESEHKDAYSTVLKALLSYEHVFVSLPTSPHKLLIPQQQRSGQSSLPTIASLSLHPVLEALLHILNVDLPSAHFLSRHAEVSPKWESMYVHGMLHRIEGDIDNTRAWYGDVKDSEIFKHVWLSDDGSRPEVAKKGWEEFLDRLERYRDRTRKRAGVGGWEQDKDELDPGQVTDWKKEAELLRETSLWEIKKALKYIEQRFGTGQVLNAKQEFLGRIESGNEEQAKVAQSMVTGGEGWRVF